MFDAKFKLLFFDRKAVTDPAERAEQRAKSKFGAFVRRSARSSIKAKKGASRPGQPPHAHSGYEVEKKGKKQKRYLFRDSILFGQDPRTKSVIVGPVLRSGGHRGPTTPEALELGGVIPRFGKPKRIRPRPFMKPALDREMPKFANLFRGSISGG